MQAIRNATRLAQMIVSRQVTKGDTVVDATCGNGKDTLFLAQLVGCSGRVFAFDIQAQAIEATRRLLNEQGCGEQLNLIHDSHSNLKDYIQGGISAAMFNLGYLPGSDHSIKTNPMNTVKAINSILEVLNPGGVVTIVCYPGHEGGEAEYDTLEQALAVLSQQHFEALTASFVNQANYPSRLFSIIKLP